MTELRFDFEWVDAGASRDRLSQVTMADLRILLGDQPITSHVDEMNRSHRERLTVPLFPIAEWLTANWWALWNEQELVGPGTPRSGYHERHDLAFAGRGFVYPRLTVSSLGDLVELRATKYRSAHASIEFIRDATAYVDKEELESEFSRLIGIVTARLHEHGESDESMEADWEAIQVADEETRDFCRAAASMGLDPFDIDRASSSAIEALWNTVPAPLRSDIFASVDVEQAVEVGRWITSGLETVGRTPSGHSWRSLRDDLAPSASGLPWGRGFDLAQRARALIGNRGSSEFDFSGDWSIGFVPEESPTDRLNALVSPSSPSCLGRPRRETGKRFVCARALSEFLTGEEGRPCLLTSLSGDHQAQSRAFAAEFLAPSASLRVDLGGSLGGMIDPDRIEELTQQYRVSSFVIQHQIQNHGLGILTDVP